MSVKLATPAPSMVYGIDLLPYKPSLFDLQAGATKGMRTEQPGWIAVRCEIVDNQPTLGNKAGITTTDFKKFVMFDTQYNDLLLVFPRVKKAVEVLRETEAYLDDQRHKLATHFANSAERHADAEGGDSTLSTVYEKCISYRSISADKAVKTRQKNQEAQAAGDDTEAEGPTGPTDPTASDDDGGEGVSRIPSPPPDMIFNIDLIGWKGVLKDLPAGATRGMRRAQPEFDAMSQEIVDNQTEYGDRAGITATDFDRFVLLNKQIKELKEIRPTVEKAEEVVRESLAYLDHQRHKLLTQFADNVEAHAAMDGSDPKLLTAYEKTIFYRGVIAEKAAKTRRKNGSGGSGPTGPTAGTTPVPTGATGAAGPTG